MTKKRKREDVTDAPSEAGNTSSAGNPEEMPHPWTDEEMASANPLPLPTVDTPVNVRTLGVPYAGKGEIKPAGRPKGDDEAALK
jgi:hypothetical protein